MTKFACVIGLVAVLVALAPGVRVQAQAIDPFTMRAVKTASPPTVDGVVDANEWRDAARVTDFIQFEPNRGEPSKFKTEVTVLYDDAHLYVAFVAHDPEPVMGQMTQRDAELWNDDSVQVYLDTFHDGRSGYFFMTNVLGTQLDGRLAEDGMTSDNTWDAPWVSVTQQTDFGYTVEVSISLDTLQYAAGDDTTWGINFGRSRRRTLERSYWSWPVDHWGRMSQAGDLIGLNLPSPARRHQVIPYALSQAQEGGSLDASIGLDARYALTPQTSAYVTVNPDFATIEADQEEINLTRFEGQELFGQRIRTFYSRRIGDISGGAKVLGTQGGWNFAGLSAQGELQGSTTRANYTVARVRRDVATRSNLGFMLANRSHDGRQQGSVEIDANLFFTEHFGFTGQFVKSYGEHEKGTVAFFARPSYDSPTAHAHVRSTHLGDRVADNINAVGFIRDDDRREIDGAVRKTLWVRGGAIERLQYGSNYNIYWGQAGLLRSWKVDESLEFDWRNRWSTSVSHTEEFKRFEKDFRNRQTKVELGYNTRSYESVRGGYSFGRNFDADFKLLSAAATYTVTKEVSVEY